MLAHGEMSLLYCSSSGDNPGVGVIFCLLEVGSEKGMEKEGEGKGHSVSWKKFCLHWKTTV